MRSPFLVEVGRDSIVLLPNDTVYLNLFGDEEDREIAVGKVAESKDFNKLLDYVLTHLGETGLLRRKRDTIIMFLVRPEAVNSYRAVEQVVDQYEKKNEKQTCCRHVAKWSSRA